MVTIDGECIFLPEGWDKFIFQGWVYRVVFGTLVRGEQVKEAKK